MSAGQYPQIEQDSLEPPSGNELPTYDDLAQQNGPNSRAAERYADLTQAERERRRERGWGNDTEIPVVEPIPSITNYPFAPGGQSLPLHIQTASLTVQDSPPISSGTPTHIPLPFVSQTIEPTHLKINHFGSRFLPHTTSQIRCVLPLMTDKILLIGHDDGLSVLDMFPQEWTESGDMTTKGPDEAQCRPVWRGESVYQMTILESEDRGTGTPQGVVLAVVGPSQDAVSVGKDVEALRTARMYNLGSLISLARWTIAQKGAQPLNLRYMGITQAPSTPSKKHKAHGSIARNLKALSTGNPPLEPPSSYQTFLSPTGASGPSLARGPSSLSERSFTNRSVSDQSTWDVVDDLPLRWATDFVPLASPGSRLVGVSVLGYATWSDENRKGTGGQLLAITTKNNILLYETPKGERAYRFVKEFYTPLQPRNIAFIQQSVSESRSPLEERSPSRFHSHKRSESGGAIKGLVNGASSPMPLSYGTHLSLFVIFDKKAGWIRLADSAVGEVELGEDGGPQPAGLLYSRDTFASNISATTLRQKARVSFDIRESAAKWLLPIRCTLPVPGQDAANMQPVYILTRGKRTHILPCPLPTRSSSIPPLHAVFWKVPPKHVSARLIPGGHDPTMEPPMLQLIAFGENGVEIQEMGISFMSSKGKGRAYPEESLWAEEDLGGETGFLSVGGNWDRVEQIYGSQALSSASSIFSVDTMDSADIHARLKKEEGIYGWCRKGLEDWRVFWVGGSSHYQDCEPTRGASLNYMNSTASSMYL
ncbi:hypothetical protein JR316_0004398 [Psilocybe cubensis]|uniref:Uncharacterized protein n=2 Tax=Psilocybe cubensis TaxID=181762 RepID=A0ACB8H530_PSICU|nr:hypothetical protein JR316_0004398 [Psilocybe cubensis]KAH9482300.1 hypothetical protein JR316_0004398 [Psilocybe cubensis]